MYICQNLPDFILNISVSILYLSKNRAIHFSYLKLPYFAFILSNLIQKFEPAVQDWNSSIKNGMGADHGISSPPSLSIHVRYPMYLLCRGLFLDLSEHLPHCNISICFLASITIQLVLCELPSYSFYLFFPGCQCSHYYVVCMHDCGMNK